MHTTIHPDSPTAFLTKQNHQKIAATHSAISTYRNPTPRATRPQLRAKPRQTPPEPAADSTNLLTETPETRSISHTTPAHRATSTFIPRPSSLTSR